jgi:hypothetical protein
MRLFSLRSSWLAGLRDDGMRGEVGAVLGQLGMGNLREARAEYAIEGTRVEQRRPSSKLSELVAV